jgi:hypothetical protein
MEAYENGAGVVGVGVDVGARVVVLRGVLVAFEEEAEVVVAREVEVGGREVVPGVLVESKGFEQ